MKPLKRIIVGYRSGSTMLAEICEASGMRVYRNKKRDTLNDRKSDESYKPNKHGLYEPQTVEVTDPRFPYNIDADVIKMPIAFFRCLGAGRYNVILMLRDYEEQRQSAEAARFDRTTHEKLDNIVKAIRALIKVRTDIVAYRELWYPAVVKDPSILLGCGWPITPASLKIVDEEQYRFRRERLVVGL